MSFENDRIPKGAIMTQLVGAICEDGQKVITVSDRMVSTGDMTLAFEHPRTKAIRISDRAVVLTAGTIHEPDLIRQAREEAKGKDEIIGIAHVLADVYQQIREKYLVDRILRPQTGLTSFAEWNAEQKKLHDHVVVGLMDQIAKFGLDLILLLAGVDDAGHLIVIANPGTHSSYDNLSFCCVGMGDRHADNVFAWYKYSQMLPLNDALYIAFEAKKRAEMAGGAGPSTDIAIIDKEGIQRVKSETIATLEKIYHAKESGAERMGFDKRITELEVQTTAIETPSS